MMIKIFHFLSSNILSGAENVVINICTLVPGYEYVYVSPSGPIDDYLNKYNIKHICVRSITPISVRHVIKNYNPDIVQGHDVKASVSIAFNAHLCHKNNIKIISELHNDDPSMWKYSIRSVLYALSSFNYDEIIGVSGLIEKHYIFSNLFTNKYITIPNVTNTYRILNKIKNVDDLNLKKHWDCIFLGRLSNQKDPLRFIHIIYMLHKKIRNLKVVMVGNGPLYYSVINYVKHFHLQRIIDIVGFQTNPFKYLIDSKILVMPSKYEGLSMVALESLFLKVPAVCSYTSGLLKIINNKCGSFAKSNREFVNAICLLLINKYKYYEKSLNCLKRFNEINNIKKFISQYKYVYKSVRNN